MLVLGVQKQERGSHWRGLFQGKVCNLPPKRELLLLLALSLLLLVVVVVLVTGLSGHQPASH